MRAGSTFTLLTSIFFMSVLTACKDSQSQSPQAQTAVAPKTDQKMTEQNNSSPAIPVSQVPQVSQVPRVPRVLGQGAALTPVQEIKQVAQIATQAPSKQAAQPIVPIEPQLPAKPETLKRSKIEAVIKKAANGRRNVFVGDQNITQFKRPQHVYHAEVSPNNQFLIVWHMAYPPRQLSIYDLSSKSKINTFQPGAGGKLTWADYDLIYHRYEKSDNSDVYAIYNFTGEKLWEGSASEAVLCDSGRYLFTLNERIAILDIRSGQTLAEQRTLSPGTIATVTGQKWLDGRTVRFGCLDMNKKKQLVDIRIIQIKG